MECACACVLRGVENFVVAYLELYGMCSAREMSQIYVTRSGKRYISAQKFEIELLVHA